MILDSRPFSLLFVHAVLLIAAVSSAMLIYWWRADKTGNWLLFTIAIFAMFMLPCASYLGWIATIRIEQGLPGVPKWTGGITTLVVAIMSLSMTWFAIQIFRHTGSGRDR